MSRAIYEITFVQMETHEPHKYDRKSGGKAECHVQTERSSNYIDVGHKYVCTTAMHGRRIAGLRTRIEATAGDKCWRVFESDS